MSNPPIHRHLTGEDGIRSTLERRGAEVEELRLEDAHRGFPAQPSQRQPTSATGQAPPLKNLHIGLAKVQLQVVALFRGCEASERQVTNPSK